MKRRLLSVSVLFWVSLVAIQVSAHPGGLNASGCHHNRGNDSYHCHESGGAGEPQRSALGDELYGRVVAVTDGDTIRILDADNNSQKVRLAGIDAPEKAQPFGVASRRKLASMVAGKQVRIEAIKYDQYGRLLGNVWVQPLDCPTCGKTLHVNHAQILAGMAWWYRYYARDQSEENQGRFDSAESEAIARKRGLWSDPDPVPPWVWRRNGR